MKPCLKTKPNLLTKTNLKNPEVERILPGEKTAPRFSQSKMKKGGTFNIQVTAAQWASLRDPQVFANCTVCVRG